jgi:hypothetical protein
MDFFRFLGGYKDTNAEEPVNIPVKYTENQDGSYSQSVNASVTVNPDNGVKIDAATMPTGGSGILGWLSAIHEVFSNVKTAYNASHSLSDFALRTSAVIHGESTAGGGTIIGMKVSPSGAAQVEATSGQLPSTLGQKTGANSLTVVGASDSAFLTALATLYRKKQTNNAPGVLSTDIQGRLRVNTGLENSLGDAIFGSRRNDIEMTFDKALTSLGLSTPTQTNGATVTQSLGAVLLNTGTTSGASQAKLNGTDALVYVAGAQCYALFTAAFIGGDANSTMEIGVATNGEADALTVCELNSVFGVRRKYNNAYQPQITSASFVDPLNGSANSLFTRNGTPEAYDKTKLNLFRITWTWFGAGLQVYEIMSPDGFWVIFYVEKTPNTAALPYATKPDFYFYANSSKSTGTNSSILQSACVAVGSTGEDKRGSSLHSRISTADTNATLVKASPGRVKNYQIYNGNNAIRYFKFYDKATAPTVGTDIPVQRIPLPPNAWTIFGTDDGLRFEQGISYGIVTGAADNNTTATGTDIQVNIGFMN